MQVSCYGWALLPCMCAKICQALADPERSHPALFLHSPQPMFLLSFLLSLFFPSSSSVQQGQCVTPINIQGTSDRSISPLLLPLGWHHPFLTPPKSLGIT